jgi:hypothetical protein
MERNTATYAVNVDSQLQLSITVSQQCSSSPTTSLLLVRVQWRNDIAVTGVPTRKHFAFTSFVSQSYPPDRDKQRNNT